MKKLISLFLSTFLLISLSIPASAEEYVEFPEGCEEYVHIGLIDIRPGNQSIDIQSTNIPSNNYDLNSSRYNARLSIVGNTWLYTNYYFYPNADGELNILLSVITRPSTSFFGAGSDGDSEFHLAIYDLTSARIVRKKVSSITKNTLFSDTVTFDGLTQSHKYAVCFKSVYQPVTGVAVIYH